MKIAVAIPCYNVKSQILDVILQIPSKVERIYVVDDQCPQQTGQYVAQQCDDPRIVIINHAENKGVGGAVITAYKAALADDMEVVVKIDGDGQMDPSLLEKFVQPIEEGMADYTKGNRFFYIESLLSMPVSRKIGNSILSFVNKISSGYWNGMDPTNGYTAIHCKALALLPLGKLNPGYFFESDMLFRLGTIHAVVQDITMNAKYEDERSNLRIGQAARQFPMLYLKAFFKRVFYTYFLRDFNGASLEFVVGVLLLLGGGFWGASHWIHSVFQQQYASTGTVMLAVLPIIMGFQLVLSAIQYDMTNVPADPLQNQ